MTGAEFHGVDIDLLADYVGGALDGTPEAARVAALIAGDPGWQEAFELLAPEMATVGALLGDLPAEPMPADVIARLDTALGALSPVGTGTTSTGVAEPAENESGGATAVPQIVLDLDERRRKRGNNRWVRMAAPIGIAAGVAGFVGYTLVSQNDSASDSGASSVAAEHAPDTMMASAPPAMTASGIDYTLGTLGQDLSRAATTGGGGEGLTTPQSEPDLSLPPTSTGLERLGTAQALADCLDAIARENAGGPLTVLSIDYARFDGKPALVTRFTARNGGWAWASGVDCGLAGGGADTLGSVPVR